MRISEFKTKGVNPKGKVRGGGAVTTKPLVRTSWGEGCGLKGCHCSDGYWISIGIGRTKKGIVRGVNAKFENKAEMERILGNKITKEGYIWECKTCGRKGQYKFMEHATSRIANDCCSGKVRRIRSDNMW